MRARRHGPRRRKAAEALLPGGTRLPSWWPEFSAAVIAERGSAPAIAVRLGISHEVLRRRLALLRRRGVARAVRLTCAARGGRQETLNYVSLRSLEDAARQAFEDACRNDDAVREAALITGRHDYALTAEHASAAAARIWAEDLRRRPEVLRVDQRTLSRRIGHTVIALRW
jgi:DNA-binding Lrp family transcriptional regulator